jgi:glycosyltransferase involved in cell wall biosynthesis
MFLQATRIVARKGIELAIDLIDSVGSRRAELTGKTLYNAQVFTADSRLILAFAGMCEEKPYLEQLQDKARRQGVELVFLSQWVSHSRGRNDGDKVYSLWDVYSHADIITYPSLLEGWGNQFLEGLVAKVPMVVYRYPVYDLDIADYQFDIIELGNQHELSNDGLAIIDDSTLKLATDDTIQFLTDVSMRSQSVQKNYVIGEKNFSYTSLKMILEGVFQ